MCRSRRELSNAYLLAKFGFDTAENEPCKVCRIPPSSLPLLRTQQRPLVRRDLLRVAGQEVVNVQVRVLVTLGGVHRARHLPDALRVLVHRLRRAIRMDCAVTEAAKGGFIAIQKNNGNILVKTHLLSPHEKICQGSTSFGKSGLILAAKLPKFNKTYQKCSLTVTEITRRLFKNDFLSFRLILISNRERGRRTLTTLLRWICRPARRSFQRLNNLWRWALISD